jgi:hypothetical protein
MPRYRWTGADAFDGRVAPGEVVELRAAVGDPQPELVRVDTPDASDDTGGSAALPVDPAAHTVDEFRDHLRTVDYDDAELDTLADAERGGDARSTVLDAIERARE